MEEKAQSRYLWYARINALSFASTADTVLILYAIKVGADDFLVGLIVSFVYLTMPLMLLGKQSMVRRGAARTFALGWLLRNISALSMVSIPFIQQYGQQALGLFILIAAAFGFFAFRSYGAVADVPLIGDITSPQSRGRFIAKVWFQSNIYYLAAMVGIVAVLNRFPSIHTFQIILIFGGITGIISQLNIRAVPESPQPALSAREPLLKDVTYVLGDLRAQKLLIAWSMCLGSIVLVIPFSMLSLKNGYGISDYGALSFFIVQVLGTIIATFANTLLLDRVGPRPMTIIYTFAMAAMCALWILASQQFTPLPLLLIFFIGGLCNGGIQTSLTHYLLISVPADRMVGISMIMSVTTGAIAGVSGTLLGGGLLRVLRSLGVEGLMVYRVYFIIILVFVIVAIAMTMRLKPLADKAVKDVLGIFFSVRDWRALFALQKIYGSRSEEQEQDIIEKLAVIRSDLSEESLVAFLASPSFLTRSRAITALGEIYFSKATAFKLIEELQKGEFTTAYLAAEVLGEHQIYEAIPHLRKALDSDDVFLRGKAMLALAQLVDAESYQKISDIFAATENPRLLIHGGRAFVYIGNSNNLRLILRKVAQPHLAPSVRDDLLFSLCEICGVGETFYRLYNLFINDRRALVREVNGLLQEVRAKDVELFNNLSALQNAWVECTNSSAVRIPDCSALAKTMENRDCLDEIGKMLCDPTLEISAELCFTLVLIIIAKAV